MTQLAEQQSLTAQCGVGCPISAENSYPIPGGHSPWDMKDTEPEMLVMCDKNKSMALST